MIRYLLFLGLLSGCAGSPTRIGMSDLAFRCSWTTPVAPFDSRSTYIVKEGSWGVRKVYEYRGGGGCSVNRRTLQRRFGVRGPREYMLRMMSWLLSKRDPTHTRVIVTQFSHETRNALSSTNSNRLAQVLC